MPTYAVGIVPLLSLVNEAVDITAAEKVKQAAYADDLGGAGHLTALRKWWERVLHFGPLLGYYPNAKKSWLIVKEDKYQQAKEIFDDTSINITSDGRGYLGGYIGTNEAREKFAQELVGKWVQQLQQLSKIALSQPQAAYGAFITGFQHKLTYHIRTIPGLGPLLKEVDEIINGFFIPALTEGHHCSPEERQLLSLPVRFGGLSIPIFSEIAEREFNFSKISVEQLSETIKRQDNATSFDWITHNQIKNRIRSARRVAHQEKLNALRVAMSNDERRANDLAQMKGASSWLTSLPLKSENYDLNKREFHDAIRLRYRWSLKYLPTTCACGKRFTSDHAMSCTKGGFIHQRHNEIRDLIGQVATEISNDVEIEPALLPVTGEQLHGTANTQDEARLDVSIRGFWQRGQRAFFDVRVFNPFAPVYRNQRLSSAFSSNEREKKRAYAERVLNIEHGSFTPLVFTPYGGCGRECEKFLSTLASALAEKRAIPNSLVTTWLRTKLSFALLRAAVLCVRGSRSLRKVRSVDIDSIEMAAGAHVQ